MRIIARISAPLLFFLLAAYAVFLTVCRPSYNWDIIGYIASAKSFEQQDIESLHSFTYDQLRNSVSSEKYEVLAQKTGSGYRHSISSDPSAFEEQLPFYQIRTVYTGMIYLLYKTGVDIVAAPHLISGFAVAAAIVFLYYMSITYLSKLLVYAIPLLAVIFGVLDLSRLSTPDGLAFLAVMASVYLYLNAHIGLLLILLPIMVGIRIDLILFVIPLLFVIFVLNKCSAWKTALSTIMTIAIFLGVVSYWNYPGWSTNFYFVFVQQLSHPISMPPTLTVQDYIYSLFRGVVGLISNKAFVLYMILAAYSLYEIKNIVKRTSVVSAIKFSPSAVLASVCLFYVASHFLAYPVAHDRYFSAPYLIGTFSFLCMLSERFKSSQPAY